MERWGENAALIGELRTWLNDIGLDSFEGGRRARRTRARSIATTSITPSSWRRSRHTDSWRCSARSVKQILHAGAGPGCRNPTAGHATRAEAHVARHAGVADRGRPADKWLSDACRLTWRAKLHLHLMLDLLAQARERAEAQAITVFGDNLKDLLLAAPAGPRAVLGLDPGLRTGVKVAVVDRTGKLVATDTIYPHQPRNQWDAPLHTLLALCAKHSVGAHRYRKRHGLARDRQARRRSDQEAPGAEDLHEGSSREGGASAYLARPSWPRRSSRTLDVSLRGAVSIARRLQDPLAELVKIEPKAIGVGQYQHDVNPHRHGEGAGREGRGLR